jgi:hypothetical protein
VTEVLTKRRTLHAKNMTEGDTASGELSWRNDPPRSYVCQQALWNHKQSYALTEYAKIRLCFRDIRLSQRSGYWFCLPKYHIVWVSIYVLTFPTRLLLPSSGKCECSKLFGNVNTVSLYQSLRGHTPEDFALFEGVRNVSKNLSTTSKFEEPGGIHEASATLSTHKY